MTFTLNQTLQEAHHIFLYVIQGKNKQHLNKNILATAFINSYQPVSIYIIYIYINK